MSSCVCVCVSEISVDKIDVGASAHSQKNPVLSSTFLRHGSTDKDANKCTKIRKLNRFSFYRVGCI